MGRMGFVAMYRHTSASSICDITNVNELLVST